MTDLRELYQELIVDHSKRPRNFGKPANFNCHAKGFNPLCGDKLDLFLQVEKDVICDVKFEGSGCAISTASASIMTDALKGQTLEEATELFQMFHNMLTRSRDSQENVADMGKLAVFAGVNEFPARVKCATLAWHTLRNALNGGEKIAKTE